LWARIKTTDIVLKKVFMHWTVSNHIFSANIVIDKMDEA